VLLQQFISFKQDFRLFQESQLSIPAEVFPSQVRGTCHGVSALVGKIGAIIGSYYFDTVKAAGWSGPFSKENTPDDPTKGSLRWIFLLVTISCICGAVVTALFTPLYTGVSLEEMDEYIAREDHENAVKTLHGGFGALKKRNRLITASKHESKSEDA